MPLLVRQGLKCGVSLMADESIFDPFAFESQDFQDRSLLSAFDAASERFDLPDAPDELAVPAHLLRRAAASVRLECLSVRVPGIPFGEHIADAANWWAGEFSGMFGGGADRVRAVHEEVSADVQRALGVDVQGRVVSRSEPRLAAQSGPLRPEFLVEAPRWQDVFIFNNNAIFDQRSNQERLLDYQESILRSPTPPNVREVQEILTTLDDLQDEAATLATALMLVQKLGGRAIPGIGQVATAADALNLLQALAGPASGTQLPSRRSRRPGRQAKRLAKDKGVSSAKGYRWRLDNLARTGRLNVGVGDVLQGLQATESLAGVGIQIGGIMGSLTDAVFGALRGAEYRLEVPIFDPFGIADSVIDSCYRSPSLNMIHPSTYGVLGLTALRLWSRAARIGPVIDRLPEPALASMLTGLRLAEGVLGPWLRSGVWVDLVRRALELSPVVRGGVREWETRGLPADVFLPRTVPATVAALTRAVAAVPDRGRQAFYEELISSIGIGLMADLEPNAVVVESGPYGHLADAFLLADHHLYPSFDLSD